MKLNNKDKEKYFIPSLGHDLVEILRKIKTNKKVTPSELALYKKSYQERIVYLSENYFDKSKKFFYFFLT